MRHVFAGIPVRDYQAARSWYERLFGRPPDMVPADDEAVWHLRDGASVYVVADKRRAGNALLTLAVDGLDRLLRALADGRIGAETIAGAGGPRRAVVADPDGNRITFFQDPAAPAEEVG